MKGTITLIFLLSAILHANGQTHKLVLPVGHGSNVLSAKLNPDQTKMVTSSMDGTARVWTIDGHLLLTLKGHTGHVEFAAFTLDGASVITFGDGTVIKWNAITGVEEFRSYDYSRGAWDVALSSDAKTLAVAHYGDIVKLYDLEDATKTVSMEGHTASINMIRFDKSNKRIVTAAEDGTGIIWSSEGELLFRLKHHADVASAAFSPDGKLVITASKDSTVKIWNAETGELIKFLSPDNDEMTSASFHPDGRSFVTTSFNTLRTWDLASFKQLAKTETYASFNWAKYSPDGNSLLGFSRGGSAVIYNSHTGEQVAAMKIDEHLGAVNSVTFVLVEDADWSADGKTIITAGADHTAKIWNTENGNLIASFESRVKPVVCYALDEKNKKAATGHEDGSVKLWDLKTGRLERNFPGYPNWVLSVSFSKDSKNIISGGRDGALNIWDIATGKLVNGEEGHNNWIIATSYSPDNKKILTGSWDHTAVLRDRNGKPLFTFKHDDNLQDAGFSSSGKKVLTICDSTLSIWSATDGKLVRKFKMTDFVTGYELNPDETQVLSTSNDGVIRLHNILTGALITKKTVTDLKSAMFHKNSRQVLIASAGSGLQLWDIASGKVSDLVTVAGNMKLGDINDARTIFLFSTEEGEMSLFNMANNELIKTFDLKESNLQGIHITADTQVIAILDYGISVYDLSKDLPLFTAVPIDSADFITQEAKGYFQSSPKAARHLHYLTDDNKIINFEQLDVKYNRPDIVLASIGNTDTSMIRSYYKAYVKRIKKLGVDTSSFGEGFAVPEAAIVNAGELAYEQKAGEVMIRFSAKDSLFDLDRFNLFINENPQFGMKGISIHGRKSKTFDTTINIRLSAGKNVIHASVINRNGTESYRSPLTLFYTPAATIKEKMHFVGIGIDKFADGKNSLNYSVKDVRDLAVKLKERYKDDISIDTLFNDQVTTSNVVALKSKLMAGSINDKVILSYSGHGLLSKDFDYYLSTYSVDFNNPEVNGLPYDALESLLDSIPARQKLMLIDACHSGEVDKEEMQHYRLAMNTNPNPGLKGGELENMDSTAKLGIKNSFELMQELFVNVGRSTGATIISAAAGTQLAQERGDLKNGVFTYSILEFMEQNPSATVTELKNYVNKRVPELTNGLQVPTTRTETKLVDWKVW
jgi:WD40 repeat protein